MALTLPQSGTHKMPAGFGGEPRVPSARVGEELGHCLRAAPPYSGGGGGGAGLCWAASVLKMRLSAPREYTRKALSNALIAGSSGVDTVLGIAPNPTSSPVEPVEVDAVVGATHDHVELAAESGGVGADGVNPPQHTSPQPDQLAPLNRLR